jgi:phage gp29-like protein
MDTTRLPELTYGDVAQVDLTEIAEYVSKLASAGIIVSDSKLEEHLRLISGLPPAEETPEGMEVPNMMTPEDAAMPADPNADNRTAAEREGDELLAKQPPYEGDDD